MFLPFIIAGIALHIGWLAAAGMAVSLVTDLLDGRVSRLMGTASQFGRNLDSTVDFVLLNSLFIALFAAGRMYWYQFAVVYTALLLTLLLQLITSSVMRSGEVIVTRIGKPAGALEYVYLLFLIVREVLTRSRAVEVLGWALFYAVALTIAVYVAECIFKLRRLI